MRMRWLVLALVAQALPGGATHCQVTKKDTIVAVLQAKDIALEWQPVGSRVMCVTDWWMGAGKVIAITMVPAKRTKPVCGNNPIWEQEPKCVWDITDFEWNNTPTRPWIVKQCGINEVDILRGGGPRA